MNNSNTPQVGENRSVLARLDTLYGILAGLANEMGVLEDLITPILSECTPEPSAETGVDSHHGGCRVGDELTRCIDNALAISKKVTNLYDRVCI
jgi:hypothetical protein